MTSPKTNGRARPLQWILRVSSFCSCLAGLAIWWCTWQIFHQGTSAYESNLTAISKTLQEVNTQVDSLRLDSTHFKKYLDEVSGGLKQTATDLIEVQKSSDQFLDVTVKESIKSFTGASKSCTDIASILGSTATQLGQIPTNPLGSQRNSLYSIGGFFNALSTTIAVESKEMEKQSAAIHASLASTLTNSSKLLSSTEKQVTIFSNGSLNSFPNTLATISTQLSANRQLMAVSSDIIKKVSWLVALFGGGFFFSGLTGFFLANSVVPTRVISANE